MSAGSGSDRGSKVNDKNVRPKSSTFSNFIGKAKSKVKLFNHSENFSDISGPPKQNIRTKPKPAEKSSNEGPLARVRNMVNNKSSTTSSSTTKKNGVKLSTTTPKKQQVMVMTWTWSLP